MSLLGRLLKDFDVLTFRFYIYFLKRGFIIIITSTYYHLDNTPSFAIILPIGSVKVSITDLHHDLSCSNPDHCQTEWL